MDWLIEIQRPEVGIGLRLVGNTLNFAVLEGHGVKAEKEAGRW